MSRKTFAMTSDEAFVRIIADYKQTHGIAPRMEDVADWAVREGLVDEPRVNPRLLLIRKFKQAARRKKMRDAKGRMVRELVPASIERVDARGNLVFDVVWDWLHDMSLDHALVAFSQRDERITQQRYSATRDLESALEFNPNLAGHEAQFKFDFMLHDPIEQIQEQVEETKSSISADDLRPEPHGGPNRPR